MNKAYGTFIFRDSGYLPGILLVGYKLSQMKSLDTKLICFHTEDIDISAIESIKTIYDLVIKVDYLRFGKARKGRQQPLPDMMTRFQFLNPNNYGGGNVPDKILILDSDMLPINSFQELFKLNTPSGVINESKDHMKGLIKTDQLITRWEWHEQYEDTCRQGLTMPSSITDRPAEDPENNMGINGGLMMLKPSSIDFNDFMDWLKLNENLVNRMSWPDMQSITAFYSGKWVGIDAKFLGLYSYPNIKSLSGIHFIGPKPWQWRRKGFEYRLNNYPDYRLWANEFLKMCKQRPDLLKSKRIKNLKNAIIEAIAN